MHRTYRGSFPGGGGSRTGPAIEMCLGWGRKARTSSHQNVVSKPIYSHRSAVVRKGSAASAEPSSTPRLGRTCVVMEPGGSAPLPARLRQARKEIRVKSPFVPTLALVWFGVFLLARQVLLPWGSMAGSCFRSLPESSGFQDQTPAPPRT